MADARNTEQPRSDHWRLRPFRFSPRSQAVGSSMAHSAGRACRFALPDRRPKAGRRRLTHALRSRFAAALSQKSRLRLLAVAKKQQAQRGKSGRRRSAGSATGLHKSYYVCATQPGGLHNRVLCKSVPQSVRQQARPCKELRSASRHGRVAA